MDYTKALAEVLKNDSIASGFYDMVIKTPQAKVAKIGQFVTILCGTKTLRRPISICEINASEETLRIVYQIRGEGTAWLSTVKKGDIIDVLGPLGHGFTVKNKKNVVFVGGGIGVPPLLGASEACENKADAILGFRNTANMILTDDFKNACRNLLIATDDGSYGHHGFVTDLLKKRLEESECDLVCACGPTPMLKAIATMAEEKGIPCQVSMEERMGCGIGACLVCVCKIKGEEDVRHVQVCKYGPVIDSKEVIW